MEPQREAQQDAQQSAALIEHFDHHYTQVMRSQGEQTMQFGDMFVRITHHSWHNADECPGVVHQGENSTSGLRDALLVQIQAYGATPGSGEDWTSATDSSFNSEQQDGLREWGFHEPESLLPNWWRDVATEAEIAEVARATVRVLSEVCRVPLEVIVADAEFIQAPAAWLPSVPRRFTPITISPESTVVPDADSAAGEYSAHVAMRRWQARLSWPLSSVVEPAWFLIVDQISQDQSVLETVALAPLGPGEERVGWFRRTRHGWVADPTLARRLARVGDESLVSVSAETLRELD